MRLRARRDGNHREVVEGLRARGLSVLDLAAVGHGCPDILVGGSEINVLFELKDGALPASRRKLTPDECSWHAAWRGQVAVVGSLAEALDVCVAWGLIPVASR